jgi:hypothetical protein
VPYAYSVAMADPPGPIGSQHYIVRQSSLATVRERFFQDPPTAGIWASDGGFATQNGFEGDGTGLRLPSRQVHYFTARPDVIWSTVYTTSRGELDVRGDSPRSFRPGQVLTEDWNRYPLHPAPDLAPRHRDGSRPWPVRRDVHRATARAGHNANHRQGHGRRIHHRDDQPRLPHGLLTSLASTRRR